VLYIFDPCCAGQLAFGDGPELLGAAGWDSSTGRELDTSFTRILAQELRELDGAPCSVAHIFAKIHRGAYENQIEQAPIYVPHATKSSIILQKVEALSETKLGETRPTKKLETQQIGPLKHGEERVLISVPLKNGAKILALRS
jgi:hypothetical protein